MERSERIASGKERNRDRPGVPNRGLGAATVMLMKKMKVWIGSEANNKIRGSTSDFFIEAI